MPDPTTSVPLAMIPHPSSYADPHGRLFVDHAGRLLRGLNEAGATLWRKLTREGVMDELVRRELLVGTSCSTQTISGYVMVLEHERLPYVSYPYEWGAEMLRAAALLTLDLLEFLWPLGYTLGDAHGWNVVFDGVKPIFVDFGSIVERDASEAWRAETEFQEYFLHPIVMMGEGHDRIARALLRDFERGISLAECATIQGLGVPPRPADARPWAWYRALIAGYVFKTAQTAWSGYYANDFQPLTPSAGWSAKHHAVARIVDELRPATVLDIGSNSGWYALYAASRGAKVVAFDNDATCINELFVRARALAADVQPLVLSFVNPSPRYGSGEGFMAAAADRLGADTVLALALVHHLVFRMHLTFPQIAAGLAAYTKKHLIVEFPPADDLHVRQWMSARYAWYTLENLRVALQPYYARIHIVASDPAPRMILVCSR